MAPPSRAELREKIQKAIDLLRPHMEYNDAPENKILKPLRVIEDQPKAFLMKIVNQCETHLKKHFEELERIRALTSEERWTSYRIFGFTKLREQVMYKEAYRELMREWRFEKPRAAKKKSKKKEGAKKKTK